MDITYEELMEALEVDYEILEVTNTGSYIYLEIKEQATGKQGVFIISKSSGIVVDADTRENNVYVSSADDYLEFFKESMP